MFNPPSSQFMKFVEDMETKIYRPPCEKAMSFFQSLSIPKGLLTNDRLHTTHNSYTFNIAVSSSKWKGADESPLGLLFQRIQS